MPKEKSTNDKFADYIKLMKGLKSHATNVLVLDNGYGIIQSVMPGVRAYCYFGKMFDLYPFRFTYPEITGFLQDAKSFRKSISKVEWEADQYSSYIKVKTNDEKFKINIINSETARSEMIKKQYQAIPLWETDVLQDDADSIYTQLDEAFIANMVDKNLCEIALPDATIFLSKPFLGDLKKTEFLGYRVIYDDPDPDGRIILKFKQREAFGNIFTYAAFLKYA